MNILDNANIRKVRIALMRFKSKIKKIHIIILFVIVILAIAGWIYGKTTWKSYSVSKGAENIITKISQSQKETKNKTGEYTNNLFGDPRVVSALRLSSKIDSEKTSTPKKTTSSSSSRRKKRHSSALKSLSIDSKLKTEKSEPTDFNIAQSGDYYVEVDAENGCMIVKYRRFTTDKTTFYAFFEDAKPFCQGRHCLHETKDGEGDLCYLDGTCFPRQLNYETERPCGDDHGKQTRTCLKDCNGGTCGEWSECVCNKGYGWDGTTCKQLQTEKDCNRQQCFNGVYCEDSEILEKEIENGTCRRKVACEPNKGWQYSPWECSCNKVYLCPVNGECTVMPQNISSLELPDGEGSCQNITHKCYKDQGWKQFASSCTCNKVGTFWDKKLGEAKCSPCTQKPENAVFTSNAQFEDTCSWECLPGFDHRNNDCTKPDGQYLCARTSLQSCTDEFSKIRKMETDKKPNEGQLCYTDIQDNNILFYDKKYQTCTVCQCVVSVEKKAAAKRPSL